MSRSPLIWPVLNLQEDRKASKSERFTQTKTQTLTCSPCGSSSIGGAKAVTLK